MIVLKKNHRWVHRCLMRMTKISSRKLRKFAIWHSASWFKRKFLKSWKREWLLFENKILKTAFEIFQPRMNKDLSSTKSWLNGSANIETVARIKQKFILNHSWYRNQLLLMKSWKLLVITGMRTINSIHFSMNKMLNLHVLNRSSMKQLRNTLSSTKL